MKIDKFSKFNEAKINPITKLLEDVTATFAYIADDNPKVKIMSQSSQVSVLIPTIISPTKHYDISEYAEIHNIWNEMVQDVDVAVQQLTSRGDVEVETFINTTIYGIKLTFYISNNSKVFKINPKSITVSKVRLIKETGLPTGTKIIVTNHGMLGARIEFEFYNRVTSDELRDYLLKLVNIFNESGLTLEVPNLGTMISTDHFTTYIKEPVVNSVITGKLKRFVLRDTV